MLYTIVNSTTQCGENRYTDIVNFATLIYTKNEYTVWQFLPYYMVITTLYTGSLSYMYREIRRVDLSEFHLTVWEKSPKVSTKYILLCCMVIIARFLE